MAKNDRSNPPKPCAVCGSLFAPVDPVIDVCSRECARLITAPTRGLKIRTERETEFPAETKAQLDDEQARLRRALRSFRLTNRLRLREMAFLLGSQSGAACIAHAWESGLRPITPRVAKLLEAYIQGYRPGFWPNTDKRRPTKQKQAL